jgi:hypothetical protein
VQPREGALVHFHRAVQAELDQSPRSWKTAD